MKTKNLTVCLAAAGAVATTIGIIVLLRVSHQPDSSSANDDHSRPSAAQPTSMPTATPALGPKAADGAQDGGRAAKSGGSTGNRTPEQPVTYAAAPVTTNGRPPQDHRPGLTTDPPPFGERTIATVTNAATAQTLVPDQLGHFPRVYIKASQAVPVKIAFPEGQLGDPVSIRVEDGGRLESGKPGKADKLDENKSVQFNFQANADPGSYHVVVRKGSEERVLDFWVGPELPVANR